MNEHTPDCCFATDKNWFRYRTAALIVEEGEVLFIKSTSFDYLYTVGGGVHMGESSEECVKREVLEETGVSYEIDRLAVVVENFFTGEGSFEGKDCHVIEFYYLMKSRGKKDAVCKSLGWDNAKESIYWVPLEKLKDTNVKPSFLCTRMKDILESKNILHVITEADRKNKD